MSRWMRTAIAALVWMSGLASAALAQDEPPGRVGRISYVAGTVSFHDAEDVTWAPAVLNYPITTGDALWTDADGRAELMVAAARIRLQGTTELEALALDDAQLRLRLAQGRIDVRAGGVPSDRPYEILTPRGTARLLADGDYVVEAGTTTTPTRVGVRSGRAQFVDINGSVLAIGPGEIGVASGEAPVVLSIVHQMPPPMPPEWAARDRVAVYRPTSQYLSSEVTGYDDLDNYGTWLPVSDYGPVWTPYWLPADWAPYRYGRWAWVRPWGWTWVDDLPWGFAPFHYGRWVVVNHRWCWVPPGRHLRPIYAPALVGFVGGPVLQIGVTIGRPGPAVGWFPLGPREVYVPSYSARLDYIRRLNAPYVANLADVDRRVRFAERRGDQPDGERWTSINQRHATVVPAQTFLRSERVNRAALPVSAEQLVRAEVAPVAAPPVTPSAAPPPRPGGKASEIKGPTPPAPATGLPPGRTQLGDLPTIGRPERIARPPAPGPAIGRATGPQGGPSAVPSPAGRPEVRTVPPSGATPPPASAPGLPPLRERPGAPTVIAPRPSDRAVPPAPSGPQATPKPTEPATPTAPTVIAPRPSDRTIPSAPAPQVRPAPRDTVPPPTTAPAPRPPQQSVPPTVVTPKPSDSVAPPPKPVPPSQVSPPPRAPERLAPPPVATPAPPPKPMPSPQVSPPPRAPERVAPPPPPRMSVPPPPPPPPVAKPAPPPPPPPPPPPKQQQQQQQQDDDRRKFR